MKITELDPQFHKYKSLVVSELKKISDSIIEAIKNKRAENQLIDLINRANNCSDSDLWNFIQELEKFSSISPPQKHAVLAYQNEVDTTLTKLNQRWNNLDEETKLENYWNNAIQKFDDWIKEGENLQLADHNPFSNFTEEIKKHKTKEAIEKKEQEAYQYILTKFKEAVKQELGSEWKTGEYSEIDNSKNLAEVKSARDNIKRQRPNIQLPPTPQNSSELTFKTMIRVAIAIGGSIAILVLIGIIVKKWKRTKNKTI